MRSVLKLSLVTLLIGSVFASCDKEYEPIEVVDEQRIQSYITSQKLSLIKDSSGIYYKVLNPGNGAAPKNSEIIYFTYTAKSVSGTNYYTSASYTSSFNYLGYVKPDAWRFALSKINKGGKVQVVFPSSLGFGRNGANFFIGADVFKGNDVLDSELELLDVKSVPEMEDVIITKYLAANSLTGFEKLPSGVRYKILVPGSGLETVKDTSTLTVAFTGKLLNGTVFDSATKEKAYTSKLNSNIDGWKQTLLFLKKGGKIRILIPSFYGYGGQGSREIPPNSILDFEVELTDIKSK